MYGGRTVIYPGDSERDAGQLDDLRSSKCTYIRGIATGKLLSCVEITCESCKLGSEQLDLVKQLDSKLQPTASKIHDESKESNAKF